MDVLKAMIDPGALFAGLGAVAAGVGIFRFGASRAAVQNKAMQAFDLFISTQDRIALAQERQAAALEANAKLIPLLEAWHSQQEQTSLTLRVLSREVHELRDMVADGRNGKLETGN